MSLSETSPYTVFVFDHDECGAQTTLTDAEPSVTETCSGCGEEVTMIT